MSSKILFSLLVSLLWFIFKGRNNKRKEKHYLKITAGISVECFSFLLPVIYITVMVRVLAILLSAAQICCDILCAEGL